MVLTGCVVLTTWITTATARTFVVKSLTVSKWKRLISGDDVGSAVVLVGGKTMTTYAMDALQMTSHMHELYVPYYEYARSVFCAGDLDSDDKCPFFALRNGGPIPKITSWVCLFWTLVGGT